MDATLAATARSVIARATATAAIHAARIPVS
jgi:hypothetical protein